MGMLRGYVVQVILIAWISGSLADQILLPAPENISMVSINMKHFLHWDPVMVAGNVTYSVQSQGEFESQYMNHTWHKASNCQKISAHQCNVTDEVFASVMYKFQVRAILGNQQSAWAELEPPFNRKTTILTPPKLNLQVSGLNLVAQIEDYGSHFQFYVFYWQKGKEDDRRVIKPSTSFTSTFLGEVKQGKEYCAEVIAHARPINRNSSSSDTVCVQVDEQSGLFTGLLCVFGVVLALAPMVFACWKATTVMQYICCPNEEIPDALKELYVGERMLKNCDSGKDNTEEIYSVELHEHILSWGNSSHVAKLQRL
ncbi:interleukin-20 receptor subunit beta isoform X2 [Dendropsophus ebraccatus]|uniref:interleukin-20 receptor subunit beta isoform X2 n=1 Tax=Dendropsophus ebraccatus TaxID=150705 RepID=UPI0038312696